MGISTSTPNTSRIRVSRYFNVLRCTYRVRGRRGEVPARFRCTGYQFIVDAVREAAAVLRADPSGW